MDENKMVNCCTEELKCKPCVQVNVSPCCNCSENSNGHSPYIGENGNWFEWSVEANDFVDTGVRAEGLQGEKGDAGAQGPKGDTGAPGPKGDPGAYSKMTLEYATIVSRDGAPNLSGSAKNGYSTNNIGSPAMGFYNYDLMFPTLYNPESDILEIQQFENDTWSIWSCAPFINLSNEHYGIGFSLAINKNIVKLSFGRNGTFFGAGWSNKTLRVVKRTFPI